MARIAASVGRGGRNAAADVRVVQRLLNDFLPELGRVHPLDVDGKIGKKTLNAIARFQKRVVGIRNVDGRVDPGGKTFKALQGKKSRFTQLPEDGAGFYRYAKRSRQYGTAATIRSLKSIARQFHEQTGLEFGIGDISLRLGGKMPPHGTHKGGFQVDLRPLRLDDKRSPVTIHNEAAYDRSATRKLVRMIRADDNFHNVLFNDGQIRGVTHWSGHHNHLHVRFEA